METPERLPGYTSRRFGVPTGFRSGLSRPAWGVRHLEVALLTLPIALGDLIRKAFNVIHDLEGVEVFRADGACLHQRVA